MPKRPSKRTPLPNPRTPQQPGQSVPASFARLAGLNPMAALVGAPMVVPPRGKKGKGK
jgi:hypothetical protein